MKLRNASGRFLALFGASAIGLGVAGCEPRNDDINRVQPGYVRKAIFQSGDEWHYRRTIAKAETTNSYIIEGHGDIALDRVKFEIQENLVIAYKPYEAIPGAQTQEFEGNEFFKGTVLAAWPVISHFDIIRGYDPSTGNKTNVIEENTTDRPWYERDYMRVNWAANSIEGSIYADYSGYWFPVTLVSTGRHWTDLQTRPTDPYASRFSDDYIEVTTSDFLGMDIFECAAFTGYSLAGYPNCGFGEAKVRRSFTRMKAGTFQPVNYPDSVVRKDANGEPMFDPDTGEVQREPIYDRFGIFRLEVPTYDRGYGHTESGRLFRAMVFNIWENHTDAAGNPIAPRDRTPKPIIYYVNAEYPERYKTVYEEVAADYSRIFSQMVADVKGVSRDQVPDMFQILPNACNEQNIINYVGSNPDLLFAVERAVCADGQACSVNSGNLAEHIGLGNLTRVCTSLEAATLDMTTGKSDFDWQRIGDNRHNMVVWLSNPQESPWGGYGPMHADARTGETISATAFLRGFAYEVGASNISDYIGFLRDEEGYSVEDIIYGQTIRRHATRSLARSREMATGQISQSLVDRMDQRLAKFGKTRSELLVENANPRHLSERLNKLKGSKLEERLVNEYDMAMAAQGAWDPRTGVVTRELLDAASPLDVLTRQNPTAVSYKRAHAALGSAGFCFLKHEFDPHWESMAEVLADKNPQERYDFIAHRLIKHVMLHELGHNVGLAHNFEGSYDALNYDDKFWDLHIALPGETPEEQKVRQTTGGYDEFRHTSVMEYLSSKGAFSDFMGKYDEAALRFVYANQVAVFSGNAVDPGLEGGQTLRNWRYYNDYNKIPGHLCGDGACADRDTAMTAVRSRSWVQFDPQNPPQNEVPFLFCDNYFNRMTPYCATFDYGSSMREIFANYYSMWSNYFFFNNFIRDRVWPIAWDPNRAMQAIFLTYDFVDVVAQYYYYLNASDPAFQGSDIKTDMLGALYDGLNMAAEVISTPEPIRMCPWPGADPAVYLNHAYLDDCDQYVDINSDYAIAAQAIQPPIGDARPAAIGFTADYEDYFWSFVGSYFDKRNVLLLLGWSQPTLFRFNYDLDFRNYFISLYRLFEPELNDFYRKLMNLDGFFLRQQTALDLGSYWCRDAAAPNVASLGHFEPRKMVDRSSGVMLPGPSAECASPAFIYPTLLSNMPYTSMAVAHALFSSDFDNQLDMGKQLKVWVVGSDDDFADWTRYSNCETAPAGDTCYCALVDQLTGLEYRALQPAGAEESIACRVVTRAQDAQNSYNTSQGNPFYKDNWREWIERLEYLRELYRLYHNR